MDSNSLTFLQLVKAVKTLTGGATWSIIDANSKLVDVLTVADEDHVGNSLMHTWELKFGNKAKLLFRL